MNTRTATRHRREATQEQKDAAAEKRQRLQQLTKQIAAMTEEQRQTIADRIGIVTCELHPLTPFNSCLLLSQIENATVVGGFQQWRRQGRQVRKGEHGACIWVPKHPKDQQESETRESDGPNELRFILVTVFDISQTEPKTEGE